MLVVLGVIVIILLVSVPAFNSITEGRKSASARNMVSAALSRARAEAIKLEQPAGVFFFYDEANERTRMAVVALEINLSDPDPYDEYKAFLSNTAADYAGSNNDPLGETARGEPFMFSDRVIAFANDVNDGTGEDFDGLENVAGINFLSVFGNRPIVLTYERTTQTVDKSDDTAGGPPSGTNDPFDTGQYDGPIFGSPNPATASTGPIPDRDGNLAEAVAAPPGTGATNPQLANRFALGPAGSGVEFANSTSEQAWALFRQPTLDRVRQLDVIDLPAGIGVQLITGVGLDDDLRLQGALDNNNVFYERYVRTGVILFSPQGRLLRQDYLVLPASSLGSVLAAASPSGGFNGLELRSTIGLVIFDEKSFDNAQEDGTAQHWLGNLGASVVGDDVITSFDTTKGDGLPAFYLPQDDRPANTADEYAEERWLDANTKPLLINRASGQLSDAD